jgi:hypothetical protein
MCNLCASAHLAASSVTPVLASRPLLLVCVQFSDVAFSVSTPNNALYPVSNSGMCLLGHPLTHSPVGHSSPGHPGLQHLLHLHHPPGRCHQQATPSREWASCPTQLHWRCMHHLWQGYAFPPARCAYPEDHHIMHSSMLSRRLPSPQPFDIFVAACRSACTSHILWLRCHWLRLHEVGLPEKAHTHILWHACMHFRHLVVGALKTLPTLHRLMLVQVGGWW